MLTPADLVGEALSPSVDASGVVTGAFHVLDLDTPVPAGTLDRALLALQARSAVVVGAARRPLAPEGQRLAEVLDTTVCQGQRLTSRSLVHVPDVVVAIELVQAAVTGHDRAALVVAALLRQTALLPVAEALAAEAAAYSTLLGGPDFACWLAQRGPARPPVDAGVDRVRLTRKDAVLEVRLTRVRRRNAFDAAMRHELSEAFAVALADPGLRVHVVADGPVFSAGGDLDEFGSATDPSTAWVVRVSDSPGHSLSRLQDRSQAWVHGPCAGAGVELPAFAGMVIADPATTFRLPELAMGLLPGAGGTVSLPRRIGRWRTAWLALTGCTLDAVTALEWGLTDRLEVRDPAS